MFWAWICLLKDEDNGMRKLSVFIEINGRSEYVGEIVGHDSNDAGFTYGESYLENPEHRAISIGLPMEGKTFDAVRTRIFLKDYSLKVLQGDA